MSKDPAFLFYPSDFLTGVSDLTMEERGQYITLLCLQHQKHSLTIKAIKLSAGNVTADVLSKFQKDENGNYYNARLRLESEKRAKHSDKQRDRAKKGWEKRRKEASGGEAVADAAALPLINRNVNRNKDITIDENGNEIYTAELLETFPFEDFWNLYDKKTSDKKKCNAKFDKLNERDKQQIFETLPEYKKATPDKQFRKNPETYLNNRAWEHEIIIPENNGQKQASNITAASLAAEAERRYGQSNQ